MDLSQFAWRDGVLLIVVAIAVYLAIMLLRLMQVSHRPHPPLVTPGDGDAAASNDAGTSNASNPASTSTASSVWPFQFPLNQAPIVPPAETFTAANAPADAGQATAGAPASFAETLEASRLDQEVRELRAEVAALREELAEMQAARRVSPQYADAMALARRGFDAQGIADHCGIARGEAELVMSLARGSYELNAEDDYVGTEHRGIAAGR